MCGARLNVRFTLNSDRESEIPQKAMSALAPKADMCSAPVHVALGQKRTFAPLPVRAHQSALAINEVSVER
jgi:hypothetical protein